MKTFLYTVGGVVLGGVLAGLLWSFSAAILKGLLTLGLAVAGGYAGYQYATRHRISNDDWRR